MIIPRFAHSQVGIVIKALNERANIARSIQSALQGTPGLTASIILADSGSDDGTIEIARNFPIHVVQLADLTEKSCGIGAQLGFQHLDCDYVYILDGDMELFPDFIPEAITRLVADPGLAGVAGLVEERGEGNYEFDRRKATQDGVVTGTVESLDMGGLYRADLVRKLGYLTNRNLHSYEEKELAFRLRSAGYRLERIARPAIRHFGKTQSTGQLLLARWQSRHLNGPGELLRSARGKPWFRPALSLFWRPIAVLMAWLVFAITLPLSNSVSWLPALPLVFQATLFLNFWRRTRKPHTALIAFVNLQVISASLARGLFQRQQAPDRAIRSIILA